MTYLQSIILGGLQGVTELFPVSSLGHSVILPSLLGWNIDQSAPFFLIFLVATHLATSLVLFGFFWKDWLKIVSGIGRSLKERVIRPEDTYARLGWLIIVASIPAGLLGVLFQDKLQILFASPVAAACFLTLNGMVLFGAERLKKHRGSHESELGTDRGSTDSIDPTRSDKRIAHVSWGRSVKIGCAQALALIPGFSRTGTTLSGGLLVGLDHLDAARFSFLLATPIIFAAAVLKLPDLLTSGASYPTSQIAAGAITAAVGAYFSVRFLTRYFRTKTLKPFAAYCCIAGLLSLVVFWIR